MARVTLFFPGTGERFFYNVDAAVGPGCPNQKNDVLLVQYFLRTINNNPNSFAPPLPPLPLGPGEIITLDGIAGPITFRAIKHFQEVGRARGNSIATDGRVDRAVGKGTGALTQSTFTIVFLNNAFRAIRPGTFQNIAMLNGDIPQELRDAFSLGPP